MRTWPPRSGTADAILLPACRYRQHRQPRVRRQSTIGMTELSVMRAFSHPHRRFRLPVAGTAAIFCLALLGGQVRAASLFTDEERARIVAFWNEPGRFQSTLPLYPPGDGPWQVRLTPEGSRWFLAYQRAIGGSAAPPTMDAPGSTPRSAVWEKWVQTRLEADRWSARATADAANAALQLPPVAAGTSPPPPPPGPIPPDLLATVGNPPVLARAVTPLLHTVAFEDGEAYPLQDHVAVRPRYAYYRFPQGVMALGPQLRTLPESELDALFQACGFSPSEQRVAKAVSRHEGGFESINTYDTGYVSVGFIQFASLEAGKGSLSAVLLHQKRTRPEEFERDFRRYGLDVDESGTQVCVDPGTGAELAGPVAISRIVDDRRLIAVFQRAGRRSQAFRVAQLQIAKLRYWPGDDPVRLLAGGQEHTGKVSDVIRSEAGLATLFDRKVNRGSIAPFPEVVARVMETHGLSSLAAAGAYEREIIAALKYREDFLANAELGQPTP